MMCGKTMTLHHLETGYPCDTAHHCDLVEGHDGSCCCDECCRLFFPDDPDRVPKHWAEWLRTACSVCGKLCPDPRLPPFGNRLSNGWWCRLWTCDHTDLRCPDCKGLTHCPVCKNDVEYT